jgi:hypothetical protein
MHSSRKFIQRAVGSIIGDGIVLPRLKIETMRQSAHNRESVIEKLSWISIFQICINDSEDSGGVNHTTPL